MKKKSAIILGATGLTGQYVLQYLIDNPAYEQVTVISRRPLELDHPKVHVLVCDLFKLENIKDQFKADEVYCCIGTTKKKTPDQETYKRIDHGIPLAAATLCKTNGINTFIVISSMGADPQSRIFYNRTKGEMERDVLSQKIEQTYILRPSIIEGSRNEHRIGEKIGIFAFKVLNGMLVGSFKKYRSIHAKKIAKAMIRLADQGFHKPVLVSNEIQLLGTQEE